MNDGGHLIALFIRFLAQGLDDAWGVKAAES
jgi:hypothetical protein